MLAICDEKDSVGASEKHTGISVLEVGRAGVEGSVDLREKALVKVAGVIASLEELGRLEVVVGADLGVCAAGTALEPLIALRLLGRSSGSNSIYRNVLVVAKRTLNLGTVGKGLLLVVGRVETLQEDEGRVVKDSILGRSDLELGEHGSVGGETLDLDAGVVLDVAATEEITRGVNLIGSKSSEVDRLPRLGGTVTVAVEDVDAENLFGRDGQRRCREGREEQFGVHCLSELLLCLGEGRGKCGGGGQVKWQLSEEVQYRNKK